MFQNNLFRKCISPGEYNLKFLRGLSQFYTHPGKLNFLRSLGVMVRAVALFKARAALHFDEPGFDPTSSFIHFRFLINSINSKKALRKAQA